MLAGDQAATSGNTTTLITIPAGDVWVGTVTTVAFNATSTSSVYVDTAGTGVYPTAGFIIADAVSSSSTTSQSVSTPNLYVYAPAGNSVTLRCTGSGGSIGGRCLANGIIGQSSTSPTQTVTCGASPCPVSWSGQSVSVSNLPATQPVSWSGQSVNVGNFPTSQAVTWASALPVSWSGQSVNVGNFPTTQQVTPAAASVWTVLMQSTGQPTVVTHPDSTVPVDVATLDGGTQSPTNALQTLEVVAMLGACALVLLLAGLLTVRIFGR
jgi:hypothetical protein